MKNNIKQLVIQKTTKLIYQKGIRSTSINEILAETGISKGSLYFHFKNKKDIIDTVLKNERAKFLIFFENSLKGNNSYEKLLSFLDSLYELQYKSNFTGGCIYANTAIEFAEEQNELTIFAISSLDEWIAKIEELIQNAQNENHIRKDLSAHMIAEQTIATIEGGILLSRTKKSPVPLSNSMKILKQTLLSK
ncbi:TetR/AcrR family transcriptional regulator [Flexistipes sp.]|uniref:TetR/AcrR family transcriptional regulator n=1 Tax=Flexistipes sp. TaxID=3088135 RepID=UPI002E1F36B6|nr:TetR/AcrR family transcriptional regulator [Flexistipes sp.]